MQEPTNEFDSLPPAIVDALRQLDGPGATPDPLRDARVLAQARAHLEEVAAMQRKRRAIRLFFAGGVGSAVAATIALALLLVGPGNEPQATHDRVASLPPQTPRANSTPGDLDHNGTLDILDAYALARRLERGQATEALDLNGDGQVNQLDIDWIASQSVALDLGGRG